MSRPAKLYAFDGGMHPLTTIAAAIGIAVKVLHNRLAGGWSEHEAFTTPIGETRASKLRPPPAVEEPPVERDELLDERAAAELPRDPVEHDVPAPRPIEPPRPRGGSGLKSHKRVGRWLELELADGRLIAIDPLDVVGCEASAVPASEFDTDESLTIYLRGRESEHIVDVDARELWRIVTLR